MSDKNRLEELREMSGYEPLDRYQPSCTAIAWIVPPIGFGMIIGGFFWMFCSIDTDTNPLWCLGTMFCGIFVLITGLAIVPGNSRGGSMTSEEITQINLTTTMISLNTITMNTASMINTTNQ